MRRLLRAELDQVAVRRSHRITRRRTRYTSSRVFILHRAGAGGREMKWCLRIPGNTIAGAQVIVAVLLDDFRPALANLSAFLGSDLIAIGRIVFGLGHVGLQTGEDLLETA